MLCFRSLELTHVLSASLYHGNFLQDRLHLSLESGKISLRSRPEEEYKCLMQNRKKDKTESKNSTGKSFET